MSLTLLLFLLSGSASPQESLPIAEALPQRSWFGWSSCWAGDVDGDGKVDLATSDLAYRGSGGDGSGIVAILSGKDGSLLRVLRRQPGDTAFGRSLAAIGVHGGSDGQALAISGLRRTSGEALGFVRIVSVRTGETLAELEETNGGEFFGEELATGPDANGDGVPDYAVGAPARSSAGRCYLYSGRDHRLLQKWECSGAALALVGDMDGDGGADVAIGTPGVSDHRENLSAVELYSGATGKQIRTLREPKRLRDFGSSVVDVGDISGDGRNDLAIGAPWTGYANQVNKHAFRQWLESESERRSGAVYLFSGSDGALLRIIEDPEPIREGVQWMNGGCVGDAFGERLAFVKDREGQQAALLIADHEFAMDGVVHCFGIPGAQHRWSVEGDPSPGLGGDFHFGYTVYSDEAASGEPLFIVSTTNPWGGLDPRIRVLHALDGAERLRAHSSDILPRIE